jgi:hypothetical protein
VIDPAVAEYLANIQANAMRDLAFGRVLRLLSVALFALLAFACPVEYRDLAKWHWLYGILAICVYCPLAGLWFRFVYVRYAGEFKYYALTVLKASGLLDQALSCNLPPNRVIRIRNEADPPLVTQLRSLIRNYDKLAADCGYKAVPTGMENRRSLGEIGIILVTLACLIPACILLKDTRTFAEAASHPLASWLIKIVLPLTVFTTHGRHEPLYGFVEQRAVMLAIAEALQSGAIGDNRKAGDPGW